MVAHTITLVPRCTHVRVWVPARVGDALARDTTVTRSKRAGGEARKGRGVKFRKGNQADRCVYTNTESSLLVCEHVKRRLACRKKKKKETAQQPMRHSRTRTSMYFYVYIQKNVHICEATYSMKEGRTRGGDSGRLNGNSNRKM